MPCDTQIASADEATIAFVREGCPGTTPSAGNLAVTSGTLQTAGTVALAATSLVLSAATITAGTTINSGEEFKIQDDPTLYRVTEGGAAAANAVTIGITPALQIAIAVAKNVQILGAPFFKAQRMTGETIDNNPESVTSNEITGDAQDKDSILVGGGNTGGYGIEFSFDSFDEQMAAAGRGTFTERKMQAITFAVNTGTITDSGSGFISQGGFKPGMKIRFEGFANEANNGLFFVTVVAAGVLTIAAGSGLVDEVAGATVTITQEGWEIASIQAITLAVAGTGTTITDSGNGLITAGFRVGMVVNVDGFTTAANNGPVEITAVAAGVMSVTSMIGNTLIDEIAGDTVTITGNMLRNGTDLRSFTFEKKLNTDIYHNFVGERNNGITLEFAAKSIITGNMVLLGQTVSTSTSSLEARATGYTPVNSADVMDATSNVSGLKLNGNDLDTNGDFIQSWSFTLNNNLRAIDAAANFGSVAVVNGSASNSGSIAMFFRDNTYYNLFRANTAMPFKFYITDGAGNYLFFYMPRIKFNSFPVQATGKNTDIVADGGFAAFPDTSLGYAWQICKVSAA